MKIRNKKQVQKIADAVRLLHKNAKWMWINVDGDVELSEDRPVASDYEGQYLVASFPLIICDSGFDLKIPVRDTLVQLQGG